MKKYLLPLTLLSVISITSFADQQQIDAIETASMQLNVQALERLSLEVKGYEQGLAFYRLGLNYQMTGQIDNAIEALEKATELLEYTVKENDQDTESYALLAQVYGLRIAYEPMKGAIFGPRSANAINRAQKLDNENPRVKLISGIIAYNTPVMFGGSKSNALENFNQAIDVFPSDQQSDFHWGYAESYTWRGLTHLEMGNKEKALADWQQAITIEPNFGWARMLINKNKS